MLNYTIKLGHEVTSLQIIMEEFLKMANNKFVLNNCASQKQAKRQQSSCTIIKKCSWHIMEQKLVSSNDFIYFIINHFILQQINGMGYSNPNLGAISQGSRQLFDYNITYNIRIAMCSKNKRRNGLFNLLQGYSICDFTLLLNVGR